ncbi:RNA-directed DNA polymerase [Microbacterium sp. Ag1]|uniref:RNA-directed DNA polymerase n=1 Tax=Microbacterium sp. Ag1 TaxID=1643443 RepID=UPI0006291600|nr:RNA-directed DNA polymerase [Microbacterium sp. Ag1]KKX96329.1 hypothetical protein AAY78_17780 [Microbacterium sp. Ag1]
MSDLMVASALTELRRLVLTDASAEPAQMSLQLRTLQRRGLSKLDLVVQLERIRARNDAQNEDEQTEENATLALELVEGASHLGLSWDAVQTAVAWVPLAVKFSQLQAGAVHALSASDLLPSRPVMRAGVVHQGLVDRQWELLVKREYKPTTADFFRAPKAGLTTRPAALLSPGDRLVYEGLAEAVAIASSTVLPPHVVWPRGRDTSGTHSDFVNAPQAWDSEFVIRTDISNFYESVDHAYLSVVIGNHLGLRGAFPIALEAFLNSVMRSEVGLPQGPLGSDVLASAYLVDIDQELVRRNWPIARYADDILIGASSIEQARARLRDLEGLLRERGLSLANEKTRILRTSTYRGALDSEESRRLREKVHKEVARWFDEHPDPRYEGIVDAMELPEQLQWDVLYHQSVSWEEVLAEISDRTLPPWIRAYERVYSAEARRLAGGGYPDAPEALSAGDLKECFLFMSTDVGRIDLHDTHAVIDWHPTLVRDVSAYLRARAAVEAETEAVAEFLIQRLGREHGNDLEMAWLLAPAVENQRLARLLKIALKAAVAAIDRPLTAATAFRALDNIGVFADGSGSAVLERFTPALGMEVVLSRNRYNPDSGPRPIEEAPNPS